ncbi:uncharacterized protein LOC111297637 [Durio zibethinus]|uniref:Uncharacterized protein LOC111297637 n=1 Tax=Durio zibethinus TaxID=66656 RepID=A0A6P5Z6P4_DURZI|nr:uncharacterized protein LOC111297637 [Durio zibethinus]
MQQINGSWQGFGDEADEETLSLCDLVISSDANEYWNNDDFSKEDHQSNSGDLFEFFSDDFPAAAPEDDSNIIFCGKLMSFKEQQQPKIEDKPQSPKIRKVKQENDDKKKNISSCKFPWKISNSFNKSRTYPSSSAKGSLGKSFYKSLSLPAKGSKKNNGKYGSDRSKKLGDEKFDFSVKKVSILATPVKSRWYLFAFGVGRFPMEIELKDMKLRQTRKNKAMKFQPPERVGPENAIGGKERRRSGKGLWRLLKVLGWKSKHTNVDVVQASFGCKPHV